MNKRVYAAFADKGENRIKRGVLFGREFLPKQTTT
jgi:hypothetical protein